MKREIKVGLMMTSLNAGGQNMIESCRKLGWDVNIIGKDVKWEGWRTRMLTYQQFCEQQNPDSIVILIDAYDALCVRSPKGFSKLFKSYNSDIVVGAEYVCGGNCYPIPKYWKNNDKKIANGNFYVQGGCITGYAEALASMYKWCYDSGATDDQVAVGKYIEAQDEKYNIILDCDNKICYNSNCGVKGKFTIENDKIKVIDKTFETCPYFIHFPGFLVWGSVPFINGIKFPPLHRYNFAGKFILEDNFVKIIQMNEESYAVGMFLIYTLFGILIFIAVLFIVLFAYNQQRLNEITKLVGDLDDYYY